MKILKPVCTKKNSLQIVTLILVLILTGCSWRKISETQIPVKKTRNIILFIGDGMGLAHLNASIDVSNRTFFLERFPYSGFSKTYSYDNYITDSAAGGTAIACGIKTRNWMIGMRPDSTIISSIVEIAHKHNLATGVVCTSAVTDATPASFVAHYSSRYNYEDIAKDFLRGTLDVFIGGGEDHFRRRQDGADLTNTLKERGFSVAYSIDDLRKSPGQLAGLLAKQDMPLASEGRAGMLEEMTKKAIEILSRDKDGFFLMVESSMIDGGGHANDIKYVVSEVIDMDKAIGVAKKFADQNGETLIVVTADHETGGLTITGGNLKSKHLEVKFSTSDHTAVMVPIFSYGPGAERFSGIHDNTFFLDEFLDLLKIKSK